MKYLLVFALVFLVAWRWRASRERDHLKAAHKKAQANALPVDMVECAQCGVHVPLADAVPGRRGNYCSDSHRSHMET